jgi:MYXO-CTERM domain-containing protein
MSLTRLLVAAGVLAVMLTAAPLAQAQDCKTTAECPQGFVCELTPVTQPQPAPAPACPPGALCPVVDPVPIAKTAAVSGSCRPGPCTKDSECGPTQVCHTETISSCSGGGTKAVACAPNTKCDPPAPVAPPVCTETTVSTCAFKWQLPCNADADCGAGFTCMPSVTGSCSGSSGTTGSGTVTPGTTGTATPGTGASAPGQAAPLPPDSCTTTTSFPGYCQPKATTCTANTDCPADWTCVTAPTPVTREIGAPANSGGTSAAAGSSGATPPTTDPALPVPPATDIKVCESPYGYGTGTRIEAPTATAPKAGGTGGTTGSTAGGGQLPWDTGPAPASGPARDSGNPASPKAGCAVATGTPGAGAPLVLGALALVGLVLTRRRRSR